MLLIEARNPEQPDSFFLNAESGMILSQFNENDFITTILISKFIELEPE
jgi:hypothetical protein